LGLRAFRHFFALFVRQAALQPFPLGPQGYSAIRKAFFVMQKHLSFSMPFIAYSLQDPLPKANPLRVKGFPPFFASLFAK
jgi:hypothetical protein